MKQEKTVLQDDNVIAVCKSHSKELQKQVAPNDAIKVGIGATDNREWVWALKTKTKGVYEISNVPMFVEGYSLGDHVRVKKTQDGFLAGKNIKRSGNQTFGVLIETGSKIKDAVLQFLTESNCVIEGFNGVNYWGVSVPKDSDITLPFLLLLHKTKCVRIFPRSHVVDMKKFEEALEGFPDKEQFLADFESRFPRPRQLKTKAAA